MIVRVHSEPEKLKEIVMEVSLFQRGNGVKVMGNTGRGGINWLLAIIDADGIHLATFIPKDMGWPVDGEGRLIRGIDV
jgi:hypothetical protein